MSYSFLINFYIDVFRVETATVATNDSHGTYQYEFKKSFTLKNIKQTQKYGISRNVCCHIECDVDLFLFFFRCLWQMNVHFIVVLKIHGGIAKISTTDSFNRVCYIPMKLYKLSSVHNITIFLCCIVICRSIFNRFATMDICVVIHCIEKRKMKEKEKRQPRMF